MAVTSSTGLPIFQIDAETYDQMVGSGALEGRPVELLDGIITAASPQSPQHVAVIERLTAYLSGAVGRLRTQMPLAAGEFSTPEPDLAVVDGPISVSEHPRTALLVMSPLEDRGPLAVSDLFAGI